MTQAIEHPGPLVLSHPIYEQIIAHLRSALPHEGVGLLAFERTPIDGNSVAVAFYPGTNRDRSPTRYTMAPDEVLSALLDMERRGWKLGGIVHSHPVGHATPSRIDLREFLYPEALMVIVSLAGDPPDLRAWWLADLTAQVSAEVPVRLEPEPRF